MTGKLTKRLSFLLLLSGIYFISPLLTSGVFAASLKFEPDYLDAGIGNAVDVNVIVDTKGESIGGVGVKINFDTEYVNVLSITPGTIFADYPIASFDNQTGKINVSGIVGSIDQLYSGTDVFATIKLLVKSQGETAITFDYTPGSTLDSNVAATFEPFDILDEVNSLTVSGSGTGSSGQDYSLTAPLNSAQIVNQTNISTASVNTPNQNFFDRLISKIKELLGIATPQKNSVVDPYAPITLQDPNTNPNQYQAPSGVKGNSNTFKELAMYALGILLVILILTIIFRYFKNKSIKKAIENPTIINDLK